MSRKSELKFDEIGYWSEVKLDIIKDYAFAYSTILAAQKKPKLYHIYIDAFAGSGVHISRSTGGFVQGSPVNAILVCPPFKEYHLIDLDQKKVSLLKEIVAGHPGVHVHEGDGNRILLKDIFPKVLYKDYRRGLCLLDPYGLDLKWEVVKTAGQMKSIDMFLNFPVADMNRNVLWRHPDGVDAVDIERMNVFWGDDSWRNIAYTTQRSLFGFQEKVDNETVAEGFKERLLSVAGFKHVMKPLPMRNTKGVIVYYLFFASQKPVAVDIVEDIFNKYRERGAI
jgi:three-Cys-motif partner protein